MPNRYPDLSMERIGVSQRAKIYTQNTQNMEIGGKKMSRKRERKKRRKQNQGVYGLLVCEIVVVAGRHLTSVNVMANTIVYVILSFEMIFVLALICQIPLIL